MGETDSLYRSQVKYETASLNRFQVKYETGRSLNKRLYFYHNDDESAEFDEQKSLCHFETGSIFP
jgi:hypothetical protein